MLRSLTWIYISVALFSCADEGIRVKAQSDVYSQPTGASMVFFVPLRNNTVTAGEGSFVVKIPESFKNKDVVYGDVFFGGGRGAKTGASVFILAHSLQGNSPVIVFDINGNADFTDDSIFTIQRRVPFDVMYKNHKDERATAVNRFSLADSFDIKWKILWDMDSARKGQKPLSLYLHEWRMNCKKIVLPDSNVVTLYDWDYNGFYDDKTDRVVAGDLTLDTFSLVRNNPVLTKGALSRDLLPFAKNTYKLLSVNKYGDHIQVKPLNRVIPLLEQLPEFTYTDGNEKKLKFAVDTGKQFSILYFWGTWCIGCRQQSPYLLKMMDSLASVSLFTYNYGDKKEKMLSYIKDNSYPFQANTVDKETTDALSVTGYPTFILLNKKREVLLRTMNVGMVKYYLSKNFIKQK